MSEPVIISIKGQQLYVGQEPDSMELVTAGTMEQTAEGYALSYRESELTGMEGTTTSFRIGENQVTLTREGQVNSLMVFEAGRRHLSVYNTPYGALSIGVNTRRMKAELGPQGGDIEIHYDLEVEHALAGTNLFRIHVEKPSGIVQ